MHCFSSGLITKINEQFIKGTAAKELASEYNFGKSNIYNIIKQQDQFKKYDGVLQQGLLKKRKTMKPAEDHGLDKALYI